jgi:hypothetical protein
MNHEEMEEAASIPIDVMNLEEDEAASVPINVPINIMNPEEEKAGIHPDLIMNESSERPIQL